MPTSQKVQIDTYDFGASLTNPTLGALSTGTTITDGTASTCNEQTADSGVYIADFVGAAPANLIPAGTYRLRTTINGKPLKRFVTFAGVDGELVYARSERAAELDSSATAALVDLIWDEATSGHTTAGTYGGRIVRATNSNTEVQITGSNHIAADIHNLQSGVITAGDFAANSITASALATDAVTEIQSGLATAAALAKESTKINRIEAVATGTVTGAGTSTEVFVGPSATLTITVDSSGNRSAVVVT